MGLADTVGRPPPYSPSSSRMRGPPLSPPFPFPSVFCPLGWFQYSNLDASDDKTVKKTVTCCCRRCKEGDQIGRRGQRSEDPVVSLLPHPYHPCTTPIKLLHLCSFGSMGYTRVTGRTLIPNQRSPWSRGPMPHLRRKRAHSKQS